MNITIKLFGQVADAIGSNSIQVDNISDTEELIQQLNKTYSGLINLKYRIAVNRKLIQAKTELKNGEEVALLPPFSGG
jgi:molybdopterin converting factor small subunit